jgi:hypothetical protein
MIVTKNQRAWVYIMTICGSEGDNDKGSWNGERVNLDGLILPEALLRVMPRSTALEYRIIPIRMEGASIFIASEDPMSLDVAILEHMIPEMKFILVLARKGSIDEAISRNYPYPGE